MTEWPPIEDRERFLNPGTTPPVGYMYAETHEGVEYRFKAVMRIEMFKQLRTWYLAKKLDWPGDAEIASRMEHFTCGYCPDGFCTGGKKREHNKIFSTKGIRDASSFAYKAIRNPGLLVSMEEAATRAKICANCSSHTHGVCVSCAGTQFQDMLGMFKAAGRTTPYDHVLDICEVCGCIVRLRVHIAMDLLKLTEKKAWPANCWLHGTEACLPTNKEPEK